MATIAVNNATVYVGGYDLSSDLNKVAMNIKVDELDDTAFGDTWHTRTAGLRDVTVNHEGHLSNTVDPDATNFANLAAQRVMTVTSTGGAFGDVAYLLNAAAFEYSPLDAGVGDLAQFSGTAMASDGVGVARGQILLPKQTVTAAGVTGANATLGLVGTGQYLYTAIHVFSAGTTATVIVESDDNAPFSSAVTRSSTVVTAQGGTYVTRVAGPIATDNLWRVRVASVTGSFSLAVAVAIQ